MGSFDGLAAERYLSLETFRRNGAGVCTPVWFAVDPAAGEALMYVYTGASSGKVKRLRHSGRVRVAACDARGRLRGAWVEARAELVGGAGFVRGMRLLDQKYWPWKQMLGAASRLSRHSARAVIAIRPAA